MSFQLVLRFLGLNAIVFNTDNSIVRVLMVDARVPSFNAVSHGEQFLSHEPAINFKIADLIKDADQRFYYINHRSDELVPKGKWILNGDDLEILVNDRPLPDEALLLDEQFLEFIPTMEKNIYPEKGGLQVNPECLSEINRLTDVALAARIQLRAGYFGVCPGIDYEYITPDVYTFTNSPNKQAQRLASCVLFKTTIEAEKVVLRSKNFEKYLSFYPNDGNSVELTFTNVPPESVAMAQPAVSVIDSDFTLVYKIAAIVPEQLRLPIRGAWGIEYPRPRLCLCVAYNPQD